MLRVLYGNVETNYQFYAGTSPGNYSDSEFFHQLKAIYQSLIEFRGHADFVRTKRLPLVDMTNVVTHQRVLRGKNEALILQILWKPIYLIIYQIFERCC